MFRCANLTLKAPPIICSRGHFQVLRLFEMKYHTLFFSKIKMSQNLSLAAVVIAALIRVKLMWIETHRYLVHINRYLTY